MLEANVGDLFLYKPEPATGGTRGARGLSYFTDLVEVKPFHSKDLLLLPLVSFSSCQRNLIKRFQIEGMIALITKMHLIFP